MSVARSLARRREAATAYRADGEPQVNDRWSDLRRPPSDQAALRAALLAPHGSFSRLDVVARTGSTNADLVAVAADAAAWPDRSVLATDHQDAGRGRLGRGWVSPPRAALAVSVLLRPSAPRATWSWLGLLAGLAVADAVRRLGLPARLKWPNDVLLEDGPSGGSALPAAGTGKVAGVLAEVAGDAVVVGAGVNVDQDAAELPPAVGDGPPPVSLRLAGAATTDRDTLLRAYLRELARGYAAFEAAGGDAEAAGLAARVREACATLGRDVRVDRPGGLAPLTGRAQEVDASGRLVVRDATGTRHAVAAGDVVHVRAD